MKKFALLGCLVFLSGCSLWPFGEEIPPAEEILSDMHAHITGMVLDALEKYEVPERMESEFLLNIDVASAALEEAAESLTADISVNEKLDFTGEYPLIDVFMNLDLDAQMPEGPVEVSLDLQAITKDNAVYFIIPQARLVAPFLQEVMTFEGVTGSWFGQMLENLETADGSASFDMNILAQNPLQQHQQIIKMLREVAPQISFWEPAGEATADELFYHVPVQLDKMKAKESLRLLMETGMDIQYGQNEELMEILQADTETSLEEVLSKFDTTFPAVEGTLNVHRENSQYFVFDGTMIYPDGESYKLSSHFLENDILFLIAEESGEEISLFTLTDTDLQIIRNKQLWLDATQEEGGWIGSLYHSAEMGGTEALRFAFAETEQEGVYAGEIQDLTSNVRIEIDAFQIAFDSREQHMTLQAEVFLADQLLGSVNLSSNTTPTGSFEVLVPEEFAPFETLMNTLMGSMMQLMMQYQMQQMETGDGEVIPEMMMQAPPSSQGGVMRAAPQTP